MLIEAQNDASKQLKAVQGDLKSIEGQLKTSQSAAQSASVNFTKVGLGLGAVAAGGGALINKLANAAGQMEQLDIAFTTMLGSADKSKALLADIADFAAKTPFELPQIQAGSKALLAFGIEAEKVIPTMRSIGDVAAGVGTPIEELAVIFGKAKASGQLFAEDINQLTERGIPIIKELAKQFGVAESEVRDLVSSGQVGFENLEKAFASMTSEGGQFNNLMEAQSASFLGLKSSMMDGLGQLAIALGQPLIEPMKAFVQIVGEAATAVMAFTQAHPEIAKIGAMALLAVTGLSGLVAVFALIAAALPAITAGLATLGAVIGAIVSPVGLVIAAIAALAVAWATDFMGIQSITKEVVGAVIGWFNQMKDEVLATFQAVSGGSKVSWEEIKSGITQAVQDIKATFEIVFGSMVPTITFTFDSVKLVIETTLGIILGIIQTGLSLITGNWSGAWEGLKKIVESIWDGIKGTITNSVNLIIDSINFLIETINKLTGSSIGQLKRVGDEAKQAAIAVASVPASRTTRTGEQLPMKAFGGSVKANEPVIVGERGWEVFMPNTSGRIIPNNEASNGVSIGGNLIGQVVVQNEADENRLVGKIEAMLTRKMQLQTLGSI